MKNVICAAAAAILATTSLALAQTYPTQPIRWIVPFAAFGKHTEAEVACGWAVAAQTNL